MVIVVGRLLQVGLGLSVRACQLFCNKLLRLAELGLT
jgi:hypothetical protein